MTNSANDNQRESKEKRQKPSTITSFKYLGAVVSDDGLKPYDLPRIAQTTAALTKLKPFGQITTYLLDGSTLKLMRFLVIYIILYAYEL